MHSQRRFLYIIRDHENLPNEPTMYTKSTICRYHLSFVISLSRLTSILKSTQRFCIRCLLSLNSQHCVLHHGNRDQRAKVTQSVGRGVALQGQGGGGKTSTWAFFHTLSMLIISCPPAAPCKVSESQ